LVSLLRFHNATRLGFGILHSNYCRATPTQTNRSLIRRKSAESMGFDLDEPQHKLRQVPIIGLQSKLFAPEIKPTVA
jgi:hypothetical protein